MKSETPDFLLAARWFQAGAIHIFSATERSVFSKCYRCVVQNNAMACCVLTECYSKAALCYLSVQDYEMAAETVRRCQPLDEACNHYLFYLASSLAGDIEPGIELNCPRRQFIDSVLALRSLRALCKSPNFEVNMLLRAVQQAYETGPAELLQEVLSTTTSILVALGGAVANIDLLVLLRCVRFMCNRPT